VKILFLGTPEFALPCLLRLGRERHQIVGILTQPDRPAGRGKRMTPSPVKRWGTSLGVPVLQPEKLKDPALLSSLQRLKADLFVVVAYGKILPPDMLRLPPQGCINVHASLLPKYRGAAPIQRAIMAGDLWTGITIMQMNEGMDTGPILLQAPHPILPSDDAGALHDRLALLAARTLSFAVDEMRLGRLHPVNQPPEGVSYAPPLRKEEAQILWDRPAQTLLLQIRGLSPKPGAFAFFKGRRLRILEARIGRAGMPNHPPGNVLGLEEGGIRLATGDSESLILLRLQPEGGSLMQASEFARGHSLTADDFFGGPADC
jgi:methionyl-tRNA formyltransferase